MKLDRLVARHDSTGRTAARRMILAGRVTVEGRVERDHTREVDRFMTVAVAGAVLQHAERRLCLMLHKPAGVVSATVDAEHPTVIDLIGDPDRHTLHLVGRLDRASTGLLLLTNDGRWSKRLMAPEHKVPKVYRVETAEPIPDDAAAAFAAGFHFHTENLVTRPALLERLGECVARVTLEEGRYHQIKRMFHRTGNRVTALHREKIGDLELPADLLPGQWRELTEDEMRLL